MNLNAWIINEEKWIFVNKDIEDLFPYKYYANVGYGRYYIIKYWAYGDLLLFIL